MIGFVDQPVEFEASPTKILIGIMDHLLFWKLVLYPNGNKSKNMKDHVSGTDPGGGSLLPVVKAIWLTIPSKGDKCVYEDIQTNVVVVADFLCIDQDNEAGLGPTVDIRVTSAYGNEVYKKTNVTQGRFAFTTTESGTYLACLKMHHDQTHYKVDNTTAIVNLDWKMGIGTKDWDAVAKKEKIEGVELELRKSAERIGEIKANIFYLRFREASMREINEKTNKRVAQLSFVSLGLCLIVSVFQVWHLKRFFLKKKLI